MFFKRFAKDKEAESGVSESKGPDESTATSESAEGGREAGEVALVASAKPRALSAAELRRTVSPASLGFKSTAELEPAFGLIGQERALKAIQFGARMKARDFNIFVMGPPASGKSTAVRTYLSGKAAKAPAPSDWVYVNNFDEPNRPRALMLPTGRAKPFARAMTHCVDELRVTVPAAFDGEDYQSRRRAIDEEFRAGQEGALEALTQKAAAQNIAILRTPMGFTMAPMHEGKIVKPEVFNQLPESMRQQVEARVEVLHKELEALLAAAPKADKARRQRIATLNEEVSRLVVEAALDDVKEEVRDLPDVLAFLALVEADLVRNTGLFASGETGDGFMVRPPADTSRDPRYRRYMVNVVVAGGDTGEGAPVYEEVNPTFGNIIGRVEHIAEMGTLVTDFLLIKSGALHRANGGYLLIDARKLLLSPFAWEALKRALKAGRIAVEPPSETLGFITTQTLEPEPIPLDVKVVLFGDPELYYLLSRFDPDFARLFKVQADFDDRIPRNKESDEAYARLIAAIIGLHDLRHADAGAVARIIEEGARMADDREMLSIEVGRLSDIVREADHWAGEAGRKLIAREDVIRAVDEHVQRSDRLRDRVQETFERGIVLVDTTGAKVGQVNALSVLQLGDFAFGRPSRVTARVRFGPGRVTDIEREAKLGGPLHSKGVMILWGYLAGRYAEDVPLALSASLVFEQSYAGVDGDSASAAELFALVSALSEVPLKQSLSVTGSVNQWGEVQAVGGVNEKIEGFFDVCSARGLDGSQGVVIPKANVQHLMLREDVVEAVAAGRFAVHAIATVDEGMAVLTGVEPGSREADGTYPAGTINRRAEDRLKAFAERARKFGAGRDSDGKTAS